MAIKYHPDRLNPFGTGRGLSTDQGIERARKNWFQSLRTEQGLSTQSAVHTQTEDSLNPFRTGQGLSTIHAMNPAHILVSQSLWNRAGSFDLFQLNTTNIRF